jgi:cobalt-zinc-cadmium efflux system protein
LLGGAAIYWLDWTWVDPVLTLVIAGYILFMSFGLLRKTSRILMEGTPPGLSLDAVKETIENLDGVDNVHHLHVWELDEHHKALEAHVRIVENRQSHSILRKQIKDLLENKFSISHSTLELEDSSDAHRCGDEGMIRPED